MKPTAFPNPVRRIGLGILAALFVAYLLDIPLPYELVHSSHKTSDDVLYHLQFEERKPYTIQIDEDSRGLTFIFQLQERGIIGISVGPDSIAPRARLDTKLPGGDVGLAESWLRNAGMSATITPAQPTLQLISADSDGKEVAFVSGP